MYVKERYIACLVVFYRDILYENSTIFVGWSVPCVYRKVCHDRNYVLTFGTGVLHLIQINHQPDATIFQFIILTFDYSSIYFGRFPAHHQELNDCSGSLWFYLRIVVTVVLCS